MSNILLERPSDRYSVVDIFDLIEKYRAFADFLNSACSAQFYKDEFLVFVMPDKQKSHYCDLNFRWQCSAFDTNSVSNFIDSRNHEKLLGTYFNKFNLLIQKDNNSWRVNVSTTLEHQSSVHSIALSSVKG